MKKVLLSLLLVISCLAMLPGCRNGCCTKPCDAPCEEQCNDCNVCHCDPCRCERCPDCGQNH